MRSEDSRLKPLLSYFLRLGAVCYGGPTVLVDRMRRDLVEGREWYSNGEFEKGFAFCQLCPGPLATQLAMYLGWIRSGSGGAVLSGIALLFPSFLMIAILASLYVRYGKFWFVEAAFHGASASIIAVIAKSVVNLARKSLASDLFLWGVAVASFIFSVFSQSQSIEIILASGCLVIIKDHHRKKGVIPAVAPLFFYTGLQGERGAGILIELFAYFLKTGAMVFGSGLAIIPLMQSGVVETHHWLSQREFLDAIAIGMLTPGPVLIACAFIGYLVAGMSGCLVSLFGILLPALLLVMFLAPHFHRLSDLPKVRSFVSGVIAATVGGIGGISVVLGRHSIQDRSSSLIAILTFFMIIRFKQLSESLLILISGIIGVLIYA